MKLTFIYAVFLSPIGDKSLFYWVISLYNLQNALIFAVKYGIVFLQKSGGANA